MTSPWIRRTAIAVGALLLLVVVAAGVLVATFDANRYKSLAIDWMKTAHQRTLAIDGPVELSVFPRLAVKASKLRLSERGRADEFVSIDEASLAVQVLPLLRKELVVDRVAARGVRAAYRRDAQGRRNIDDFVAAGDTARPGAPGAPADAGGPALRFDISAIRLDDVRLHVADAIVPLAGDFVLESFESGRLAPDVASPVTLRATLQTTQPQVLKLALDGHMRVALDPARGAVTLDAIKLDLRGDTAAAKGLVASLDGALAWEGGALRAGPLHASVKQATLAGVALGASTLGMKRLVFDPTGEKLQVEALALALAGRRGADPFELSLDWPRLDVDGRRLAGSALAGRFKLGGANALTGTLASAAPTGTFDAVRLPGVVLTVAGSVGARRIDGRATTDLTLRPGRSAAALDRLALHATLADAGAAPLKLDAAGSAGYDGTAKAAQWTLNGSVNANRFDSNGQVALSAKVPSVRATARFDSLDLNALASPGKPAPAPAPAAPAETAVDLDALNTLNGQFTFSAGALAVRQYRIADAKVDATLDAGTLRIRRLAGRAWGGRVEASGSADARSKRVAVKLGADGVNVNALLKDVAGKDLLEGTGKVDADVATSGATLGALRSNLAGTAALQVRDGAIKGINLARALRQAKAALALKQDALTQASATEKTDFTMLTATARIANGVAQSDDLDVKSPFLRIGGAGRFDIGRGRIDYTARATVTATSAGQGGAELAALRGVTVPVRLTGPFDAIDWQIQWSSVAASVVENQLKDRLAEQLGRKLGVPSTAPGASAPGGTPQDLLRNTLKGLFK